MCLPWQWGQSRESRTRVGEFDGTDLEDFWDGLLSRDLERVRAALSQLEEKEQKAVVEHLRRMASEPGWQPGQRESARFALEILDI